MYDSGPAGGSLSVNERMHGCPMQRGVLGAFGSAAVEGGADVLGGSVPPVPFAEVGGRETCHSTGVQTRGELIVIAWAAWT